MGVGGYFSTKAECDNYRYLLRQTRERVERSCLGALERELFNILSPYGLTDEETRQIALRLEAVDRSSLEFGGNPHGLTAFLLKFGEGVETISTWRIYASAITIGLSYFIGGLIPMVSHF
jgi:vacuolar iron transporter family protein